MNPRSCLIICTLNRPYLAARLVENIQSFRDCPASIIVVDASDDKAHDELVSNTKNRPNLCIVRSAAGLPHQRNIALSLMDKDMDFVHFLDDDVEIMQGYFGTIEELFLDLPLVGGIGVRTTDVPEGPSGSQIHRALRRAFLLESPKSGKLLRSGVNTPFWRSGGDYSVDWLPGCAMSFRVAAIRGLKFDDSRVGVGWGEDVDFSHRVSQRRPLIITSRTRVVHHQSQVGRDSEVARRFSETHSRFKMACAPSFPVSVSAVRWSLFGEVLMQALAQVYASTRALAASVIRLLKTYNAYRRDLPVTDASARDSFTHTSDSRSIVADAGMAASTVWVELQGGLGNQLFGYAAGRALAWRLNCSLSLSLANFGPQSPRQFSLNFLDASLVVGKPPETLPIFQESSFAFDPRWSSLNEPYLLRGYFQSDQYFADFREEISGELRSAIYSSFATPPSEHGSYFAVQVRRGDYLREPAFSYHGICSVDYYIGAIELLRTWVGELPVIFVGDDPDYCATLAKKVNSSSVLASQADNYSALRDLWLLVCASGVVISNSSFGWWGAYLNSHSAPVVAPRPWFSQPLVNDRTLLPQSWITLGR